MAINRLFASVDDDIHNNLIRVFKKLSVVSPEEYAQALKGPRVYIPGAYSSTIITPIEVLGKFEATESK